MMGALLERGSSPALNKGAAALAAIAAAIGIMLVPVDLLQDLVLQSGLPGLFPPADPPLGMKARFGFAFAAALVAGSVVFAAMRLLGRASSLFEDEDEADAAPVPAPRVRRRDQHPDAPARAPLSASRDLGEPGAPPPVLEEPAPRVRKRMATEVGPGMPWRREGEAIGERLRRVHDAQRSEVDAAEPAPEAAPADVCADLQVEGEPAADELLLSNPEPVQEPAPVAVEPEPAAFAAAPEPAWVPPEPVRAVPEPDSPVTGRETVAELMARLERAIERRRSGANEPAAAPEPVVIKPAPASTPPGDAMDDRLQAALASLKRFAPSHA